MPSVWPPNQKTNPPEKKEKKTLWGFNNVAIDTDYHRVADFLISNKYKILHPINIFNLSQNSYFNKKWPGICCSFTLVISHYWFNVI